EVLGSDQIAAIAQRVGIPPEMASSVLAQILPKVIDQATPAGEVPEHGVLEQGLEMLKGRFLGNP
ncbi:MAG: YidB family protein, partial [Pseudonocardiaceae bacterium]